MYVTDPLKKLFVLVICALLVCCCGCSVRNVTEDGAELIAEYSDGEFPIKVDYSDVGWAFLVNNTVENNYGVSFAPDPRDFQYYHYIEDVSIRRFYASGKYVVWSERSDFGITYMYYGEGMDTADFVYSYDQSDGELSDSVALDVDSIYYCCVNEDSYELLLYEKNLDSGGKRIISKLPYTDKKPRVLFSVRDGYMSLAVDSDVYVIRMSDRKTVLSFSLQSSYTLKYVTYDKAVGICLAYFTVGDSDVVVLTDANGRSGTAYEFPDGAQAYEDCVDFNGGKLRWIEQTGGKFKYVEIDPLTDKKTEKDNVFYFVFKEEKLYTLRYKNNDNKTVELYVE